jgi:hypothetical protein
MAGCGWLFKAMEGPRRAQEDAGLLSRRRVQGGTKVPFHGAPTGGTLGAWGSCPTLLNPPGPVV